MGGNTSTTTNNNSPYAPAQPGINRGIEEATALHDRGGFNITPYSGDLVADLTPQQQAANSAAGGVAGAGLGVANSAQDAIVRAMDPSVRSAGFDSVREATINGIMPGVNSSFAGSGMTGSTLHAQNLMEALSRGLGTVENDAYQQGEQRALQAASMAGGVNNAGYGAVNFLNDVGSGVQSQNQNEINALAFQDQQTKTAERDALQDYLSLMTGVGSQFGVQQSTQRQNTGLMGMLGLGLQAAPFIFSDRRLKEDVKRVGHTDDGLPIYTYKYKGDNAVQMGVMAQEVEVVKPHLVKEFNGYKAVNYAGL